jgi:hypothetical protein
VTDAKSTPSDSATPVAPDLDSLVAAIETRLASRFKALEDANKAAEDRTSKAFSKINREMRNRRLVAQGTTPADVGDSDAGDDDRPDPTASLEAQIAAAVRLEQLRATASPEQRERIESAVKRVGAVSAVEILSPFFGAQAQAAAGSGGGGEKPSNTGADPGRGQGAAPTGSGPRPRTQLEFARLPKEARERLLAATDFHPEDLPAR